MHNKPAKWAAAIVCRSLREHVYVRVIVPWDSACAPSQALLFRLLRRLRNASSITLSSKYRRQLNQECVTWPNFPFIVPNAKPATAHSFGQFAYSRFVFEPWLMKAPYLNDSLMALHRLIYGEL
jgi:hypothetical protein